MIVDLYVLARDERFPRGPILAEADAPHYLAWRADHRVAGEGASLMREILDAEAGWHSRNPALASKIRSDRLKARRRRAAREVAS